MATSRPISIRPMISSLPITSALCNSTLVPIAVRSLSTVGRARESFLRATREHSLAAVADPRIHEATPIKKGQPFSFQAVIEVRGEIVPQDYAGLPIEKRRLAVPCASRNSSHAS